MPWAALVALAALIASACAQQSPVLGWSGYTEHQYILNATERQAVSDVVEVRSLTCLHATASH